MSKVRSCTEGADAQKRSDLQHAYDMGYDCGLNGANTTNCDFRNFSSPEFTQEWERGQRDGDPLKKRAT